MATISSGSLTSAPYLVLGYQSSRASGNVIHQIIGRPAPDITLRAAAPRTGTLELFYLNGTAAAACERLHASARVLRFSNPDHPATSMDYVASGDISTELDEGGLRWIVSVDYQEITAS